MQVQEINDRVKSIDLASGGDEDIAHSMEDKLFVDVLTAIAEGADNAKELAEAALKSRDIDFARHTS